MIYGMEETLQENAKIKVIGTGGGGCNAVNRMVDLSLAGIDFIAANTDLQALSHCHAPTILQLGAGLTRGLGAGGNPNIGREAAWEDEDTIRSHLEGADMVFITSGMGGGTGTGAAPVIAQIAKELGSLTIAVVTKPFRFEGRRRMEVAEAGIRDLEEFVDTLITIPNQKLLSTVERTTTLKEAFTLADEVLSNAVQGISDLITVPGLINLDFADVKAVMSGMGKALMGTGFGSGESKAIDAIKRAISSPLLDELSVEGARGILINITGGNDLTLIETDAATQLLQDSADPEANIIFGAVVSEHYQDRVKVTVIATGFESAKVKSEPFPLYVSNRKNISGKPETASDSITDEISESDNSLTNTVSSEAIIHDDHEEAEDTLVEEPNKSDDEVEDYETSESPSSDAENNPVLVNTLHQPELELDSEDEIDEDLEITDKIVKPEESPVLADNHAASDDTSELVQPELELSNPNNSVLFDAKLPAYKRRDLGKGQFKRQPEIDKYTIRVETSNYMIPAFMRRKAD